jgi:hypothetical protein
MSAKPDDLPQWAWDDAKHAVDNAATASLYPPICSGHEREDEYVIEALVLNFAHFLVKAEARAMTRAAKICEVQESQSQSRDYNAGVAVCAAFIRFEAKELKND